MDDFDDIVFDEEHDFSKFFFYINVDNHLKYLCSKNH